MQIILNKNDVSEYLDIFMKSKALRELIIDKLKEENYGNDEVIETDDEEKILILNTSKIEYKKRRGRPKKQTKNKIVNPIKIEEGQNIEVDI